MQRWQFSLLFLLTIGKCLDIVNLHAVSAVSIGVPSVPQRLTRPGSKKSSRNRVISRYHGLNEDINEWKYRGKSYADSIRKPRYTLELSSLKWFDDAAINDDDFASKFTANSIESKLLALFPDVVTYQLPLVLNQPVQQFLVTMISLLNHHLRHDLPPPDWANLKTELTMGYIYSLKALFRNDEITDDDCHAFLMIFKSWQFFQKDNPVIKQTLDNFFILLSTEERFYYLFRIVQFAYNQLLEEGSKSRRQNSEETLRLMLDSLIVTIVYSERDGNSQMAFDIGSWLKCNGIHLQWHLTPFGLKLFWHFDVDGFEMQTMATATIFEHQLSYFIPLTNQKFIGNLVPRVHLPPPNPYSSHLI